MSGNLELASNLRIPFIYGDHVSSACRNFGYFQTCRTSSDYRNLLLVMRLLEAKFPDYHAVIPKEEKISLGINRISLMEAMRTMLILSNERYRAVKIALENNVMELVSTNPEIGEAQENIEIQYNGERVEAGFNPKYFIDMLQAMESEEVNVGFIDNSKPCILKGEADEGFLGLIMPMRL